jgi:hypothetical protein
MLYPLSYGRMSATGPTSRGARPDEDSRPLRGAPNRSTPGAAGRVIRAIER